MVLTETCSADKTVNLHILQGRNPKGGHHITQHISFILDTYCSIICNLTHFTVCTHLPLYVLNITQYYHDYIASTFKRMWSDYTMCFLINLSCKIRDLLYFACRYVDFAFYLVNLVSCICSIISFVSDFRDVPLNDAFELLERDFRKAQNARSHSS